MRIKKMATDKNTDAPATADAKAKDAEIDVADVLERMEERNKLTEPKEDLLLDRKQAAIVLGISLNYLDRLLAKGLVPSSMRENRRIFSRDRLVEHLDSIETTSKDALQIQAFSRREREMEYVKVLKESASLSMRHIGLMKLRLSGKTVDKAEMDAIRGKLQEIEVESDQRLLEIDVDAGVVGFFHTIIPDKKGVRMRKVCIGYEFKTFVGGFEKIPLFKMIPVDFSGQVESKSAETRFNPVTGEKG
jgi:hypothetical protein